MANAVCHSFYPIDLHQASGSGLHCQPLREGTVPTVPLQTLRAELRRHGARVPE